MVYDVPAQSTVAGETKEPFKQQCIIVGYYQYITPETGCILYFMEVLRPAQDHNFNILVLLQYRH